MRNRLSVVVTSIVSFFLGAMIFGAHKSGRDSLTFPIDANTRCQVKICYPDSKAEFGRAMLTGDCYRYTVQDRQSEGLCDPQHPNDMWLVTIITEDKRDSSKKQGISFYIDPH